MFLFGLENIQTRITIMYVKLDNLSLQVDLIVDLKEVLWCRVCSSCSTSRVCHDVSVLSRETEQKD